MQWALVELRTLDGWTFLFQLVGPFFYFSCPLVCQRKNSHVVWPDMRRSNARGSLFIQWNILPSTVSHSPLIGLILARTQVQYKYILGQPHSTRKGFGKGWTLCIALHMKKVDERNGIFYGLVLSSQLSLILLFYCANGAEFGCC